MEEKRVGWRSSGLKLRLSSDAWCEDKVWSRIHFSCPPLGGLDSFKIKVESQSL